MNFALVPKRIPGVVPLYRSIKSCFGRIPGIRPLYRLLCGKTNVQYPPRRHTDLRRLNNGGFDMRALSNDELLSLMRYESHRIEKAVYNDILEARKEIYREKWERLGTIYKMLEERDYPTTGEPTVLWSRQIYDAFDTLRTDFVERNSLPPPNFDPTEAKRFVAFVRARRSVRVWADEQPDLYILEEIAFCMIDAARWAPSSGNRQAWRFLILKSEKDKGLLRTIKEPHCIKAPLLIFVGMDARVYGKLGKSEQSIFLDAGAAIMQMVLAAHKCGLGVCWNHFADDLISSTEMTQERYKPGLRKG